MSLVFFHLPAYSTSTRHMPVHDQRRGNRENFGSFSSFPENLQYHAYCCGLDETWLRGSAHFVSVGCFRLNLKETVGDITHILASGNCNLGLNDTCAS